MLVHRRHNRHDARHVVRQHKTHGAGHSSHATAIARLDSKRVEEQEREFREALVSADEYVHREMYGSSYRA